MKKSIATFIILILFTLNTSMCTLAKTKQKNKEEIAALQTRTYESKNTQQIYNTTLSVLQNNNYQITFKDSELLYIAAYKEEKIKDVNKLLITGYVLKTGFDTIMTVITYGLRSYTVAADIMLIKAELKDKDLRHEVGININSADKKTNIKINIDEILIGKRDGRPIGKKNRLKTLHIIDETLYKTLFFKIDQELSTQNIKRVAK